jgi:hypothetical protein
MIRRSQIKQAYKPIVQEELDIFDKTMSPYITNNLNNDLMVGFLKKLERIKMNNYYSIRTLENLYNYTTENPFEPNK